MNPNIKSKRHAMLGKLFIEAQERGIDQHALRDDIVPALIGRRLSAASEKQIGVVLAHITGPQRKPHTPRSMPYASSLQGLRDEIKDLAKARWGAEWERSLINLCRKFGVDHYIFLDLAHGKAVKARLVSWMREPGEDG